MPSKGSARPLRGAACLLLLCPVIGCQTLPPSSGDGHWARQAREVERQRLSHHSSAPSAHAAMQLPDAGSRAGFVAADPGDPLPGASVQVVGDRSPVREMDCFRLAAAGDDAAVETGSPLGADPPSTTQPAMQRGPLPGFGETVKRDIKRAPGELWRDTKAVYTNVPNLIILGLSGAASIALRPEADEDVADYYGNGKVFNGDWPDTFATLGNPGVHFAVAGVMYLAGQQLPHTKTYEVGRTLFSALIINDISTVLLKLAACDKSPNGEFWAWPSGHVSSTMTLAAVMHEAYGPLAGVPLYGVTTLVAIERMDDGEHWLSDVIFGAAMGWVIGHTVAGGRAPEIFGGELIPYANPATGTTGVAWLKSFR